MTSKSLLLLCFWAVSTAGGPCTNPPPIALPVTDVRLSNGYTMRGTPVSIGNPAQNFSMMPHMFLNDTWAYNTSSPFCFDEATDAQCLTQRGGEYDPSDSSSAQDYPNVYAAGGDPQDTASSQGPHIWFNGWTSDALRIDANHTLSDFPIGMPGFDYAGRFDTQANLGLGLNSTLLNALKAAGHISSRSYSYWWGLNSATSTSAMDGQLVFGGYDAAKITGPNITQKILPWTVACPSGMLVTVFNMGLSFPNGTQADMLAPSVVSACLQPDWPFLMSPRYDPFYERFGNLTDTTHVNNSRGIYFDVPLYDPSNVFPGELTIGLDQNLQIEIPNDVLVVPDTYVAPSGEVTANNSALALLLAPTKGVNVNDIPILGRPFFSSAYLMVDLDAMTFTLWQANATMDSRLVALGETCADKPQVNETPAATATGTASDSTASSSTIPPDHNDGLSTGAIAGIVIGGICALGILAGISLAIIRKKRRASSSHDESRPALSELDEPQMIQQTGRRASDTQYYPQEMQGGQEYTWELLTDERPREAPGGPWDSRPVELPSVRDSKHHG